MGLRRLSEEFVLLPNVVVNNKNSLYSGLRAKWGWEAGADLRIKILTKVEKGWYL